MKTKRAISLALFLVGSLLISTSMAGIATAEDVTVNVTVPLSGTMSLVTHDVLGDTDSSAPWTANFDGVVNVGSATTNTTAAQATVQSNGSWTLTQAISADELYNSVDDWSMSLQWDDPGRGLGYIDMTTAAATVGSGTATASTVYPLDYQITADYTDPDGNYSGTVTYTYAGS